jgi:hypothetical protein
LNEKRLIDLIDLRIRLTHSERELINLLIDDHTDTSLSHNGTIELCFSHLLFIVDSKIRLLNLNEKQNCDC